MNNNYQSPMNNGPMNNGMMNQSMNNGPMNNGMMNQSMNNGPMNNGMMNQSMNNGPMNNGMMNQSMNNGPMNNGMMNQPIYNQPMMNGPQKKKSKLGWIIGIIAVFVIVAGLCIFAYKNGYIANYGVKDLKLYIPSNWEAQDDKTYYNSDKTCMVIAGANESYSEIESRVNSILNGGMGFTKTTKNLHGDDWNYTSYTSGGQMMHIYWINYKDYGYLIALAGNDSGECLEYKNKLEKSIKLK